MNKHLFSAKKRAVPAILMASLLVLGGSAFAHQTLLEKNDTSGFDNALTIPKPEFSFAIYARLGAPGDVDYFKFEVKQPMDINAGLLVPFSEKFADFYPVYAIVGPGLPAPLSDIPFELPPGYGAMVVNSKPVTPRPSFYEPFTATRFYKGITEFDRRVEVPGTYYIVVWHPEGEYGDYLVSYGRTESFTFKELVDSYKIVYEVKSGAWGDKRGHAPAGYTLQPKGQVKTTGANKQCNFKVTAESELSRVPALMDNEGLFLNMFGLTCG